MVVAAPTLELPVLPPSVTVQFLRPSEAEELLTRRKVRVVLKHGDELWAVLGKALLVDGYARRAKRSGWTLCGNARGVRS